MGLSLRRAEAACKPHAPSALPAGRLNGLKHPAHQLGLTCDGAQPAQQDTASCSSVCVCPSVCGAVARDLQQPRLSWAAPVSIHIQSLEVSLQLAEFICISHWGVIVRLHAAVAALREVIACSHLVGTEQCTLTIAGLQAEFGAPAEQGICFLIPSRLQAAG